MRLENMGFWTLIIAGLSLLVYGLYNGFEKITSFDSIAIVLSIIFVLGIVLMLYSAVKNK